MHIVGLQGVLYYELLKPEEKVTEKLNKEQLQMFNQKIQELMPHHAHTARNVLLIHDNASHHVALTTNDVILKLGCELVPHRPTLQSDYYLFRSLSEQTFKNKEEVRKCVDLFIYLIQGRILFLLRYRQVD